MIQRVQSVYLLIAVVLAVVCLLSPLGTFYGSDSLANAELYNAGLFVKVEKGARVASSGLFALLAIATIADVLAIFGYKNRLRQMRIVCLSAILLVLYYLSFIGFVVYYGQGLLEGSHFKPAFCACLPILSFILNLLAYGRIRHDERLVRAADRLR